MQAMKEGKLMRIAVQSERTRLIKCLLINIFGFVDCSGKGTK